jgi:hypothetical protein
MKNRTSIPDPKDLTPAPLRHRLRLELKAAVPEIWELIGKHVRMPEYSAGIASVEIEQGPDGSRSRVCQFRSPDGSGLGPRLRERITWEAENVGYATSADSANDFGLENSVELVTLASAPAGVLLTWDEYYDSADLAAARASFNDGLSDLGRRLVDRFGGRIVEQYTDAQP